MHSKRGLFKAPPWEGMAWAAQGNAMLLAAFLGATVPKGIPVAPLGLSSAKNWDLPDLSLTSVFLNLFGI